MRLDRAQRIMTREEINGVLLFDPFNIRYLTGYKPACTTGAAATVLAEDQEPWLIVPDVEKDLAESRSWFRNIQTYQTNLGQVGQANLLNRIQEAINSLNLSSVVIGIELNYLSARSFEEIKRLFPDAGFKDLSTAMAELRMIKDEVEIEKITAAIQIAENGLRTAIEFIQPGITEIEVAAEVERTLRKAGATHTGYPTVVASGPRAECPYAPASRREIGSDEFVVVAVSAVNDDYCSDLTRTILTGKPSRKKFSLFECARDCVKTVRNQINQEMQTRDIAVAIRSIAEDRGYEPNLLPIMGNGVGLQPIEPPIINMTNETLLLPGLVFTIEAGLYNPELGGVRLGDILVHQRDGGFTQLNHLPLDTV